MTEMGINVNGDFVMAIPILNPFINRIPLTYLRNYTNQKTHLALLNKKALI